MLDDLTIIHWDPGTCHAELSSLLHSTHWYMYRNPAFPSMKGGGFPPLLLLLHPLKSLILHRQISDSSL